VYVQSDEKQIYTYEKALADKHKLAPLPGRKEAKEFFFIL
jgi:hypothetical protein